MKLNIQFGKNTRFAILSIVLACFTLTKLTAQQYTANFATSPTFYNGFGFNTNTHVGVVLNGVEYSISISQVAAWTYSSNGGESNSGCITAPGYGDVNIIIKRKDGLKFAFYGLWTKYTNYSTYPIKDMTVNYNGSALPSVTYAANNTIVLSQAVNVTDVTLMCRGLDIMKMDNLIVGAAIPELPTISNSTTNIFNTNSATFLGNVTADGGATVTETGFVYNTTGTPVMTDNKIVVGSGTGSFTKEVTGLSPATTYYVRAYAKNSVGTALSGTTGSTFITASPFVLAGTHYFNSAWASTSSQATPFTKYVEGWDITAAGTGTGLVSITRIIGSVGSTSSPAEGAASLRVLSSTSTEQISYLAAKASNSSSFAMKSIKVRYATRTAGTSFGAVTVQGYKAGVAVNNAVKTITGIGANVTGNVGFTTFDVSAITAFSNIDEIRISASSPSGAAMLSNIDIDELVVQAAVASNPLTASVSSQTNLACFGSATGSATILATGGTAPYTYSWSPSGGTGAGATNLTAGTYTVTVTDAASATKTVTVTLTQPTALVATATAQTNVSCNGGSNGSATVSVSGGMAPYTYSWSPAGGTAATATGLAAGNYTVIINDAYGCSTSKVFTITQPAAMTSSGSQTNLACNGGSNGAASVVVSGGVAPYTYSWSPSGGTAASATGLSAGIYTVTVTNANGCTLTRSFTLTQPTALVATATAQTNVSCNGGSNGSATVSVSGGMAPYTYSWSPAGGTSATATGLAAGNYTVIINDAYGCSTSKVFTITQPAAMTSSGSQTNLACNGGSNGAASVVVSGGVAPYTYSWSPSGGTAASATGLSAGTYTVTVTNANGCTLTRSFTLTQPTALVATATAQTNVSCNGGSNGTATVSVSGGMAPYTYNWSPAGGTSATATGLAAGNYTVIINDAYGCSTSKVFTITQPAAISKTVSQSNVTTYGGTDGTAAVLVSGGVAPYTYAWSPSGGIAATASGLKAGIYTVVITDNNGCTSNASATITQPAASSNNKLSALSLSLGTLSPVFAQATSSYSATMPAATSSVGITPVLADASATVSINGTTANSGSASVVNLVIGNNIVEIKITAQNGAQQTYTITITCPMPQPAVPWMSSGSDAGQNNNDYITNVAAPTLQGTSEPGAAIVVYKATQSIASATANAAGEWSTQVSPLAEGVHQVTVKASKNGVENTSAARQIVIDLTAPVVNTIEKLVPATANTTLSQVTFRATFSEAVYGFGVDDLVLNTTGTASGHISSVSATSGSVIDVVVNNITGTGSLQLALKTSGIVTADIAGNKLISTITAGEAYMVNVAPLPVVLGDFSGSARGDGVALLWQTNTELNTAAFEVERSSNGIAFLKIGLVAAKNNGLANTYQLLDVQPGTGANYYRLKMIDRNGTAVYSRIIKVEVDGGKGSMKLVPNPAINKTFTMQWKNTAAGRYQFMLVNTSGQVVYQSVIQHTGGGLAQKIHLPASIPAGHYTVQVKGNEVQMQSSIIL